jgi:hypothetical protein
MHPKYLRTAYGCLVVALSACLGCGGAEPQAAAESSPLAKAPTEFDAATAGTVQGRLLWEGDVPHVTPMDIYANPLAGEVLRKRQTRPNPNAPRIDGRTRGVGDAVVFLRGVDSRRAKPWPASPVVVEQAGCQFHIKQGSEVGSRVGFVRRGAAVAIVSRDRAFHSLHAGGATFFTLAFPDPEQPIERRFDENGLVELTSAAGYYWMRAYLFVDDHPYYTRTEPDGGFRLTDVPPGGYEVVCWMPNWKKARHERDPELTLITRWYFDSPLERTQAITLEPGGLLDLHLTLSAP